MLAMGACLAASAPAPLSIGVTIGRSTLDLLDSLDIAVAVHNSSPRLQTATFARPAEYEIDVLSSAGGPVWTSLPASPPPGVSYAPHSRSFNPGPTTIVVNDWNQLTTGGWSPLAGTYTVRVRLLADGNQPSATARVTFLPPLTPGVVPQLKAGQEVTLGGELDPTREFLLDGHGGSARLTRRLLAAPPGTPVVVRGYADDATHNGGRTFTYVRWAFLGQPPPPAPATPAPQPLVKPRVVPAPSVRPTASSRQSVVYHTRTGDELF